MPKIDKVLKGNLLPPLQQKVYDYLSQHNDEVFSWCDGQELAELIDYSSTHRSAAFSLWLLYRKGYIDKVRLGRLVYFGNKVAISELRKKKDRIANDRAKEH